MIADDSFHQLDENIIDLIYTLDSKELNELTRKDVEKIRDELEQLASTTPKLQLFQKLWDEQWLNCPPFSHQLRQHFADRWLRFYSLPDAKRYPENENEYASVLTRQYSLLSELGADTTTLIISTRRSTSQLPTQDSKIISENIDPILSDSTHWQSIAVDTKMDESYPYAHIYLTQQSWQNHEIDQLLRAVMDDKIDNIILAPTDFRWLFCPYDGGVDIFIIDDLERSRLKELHASWLSDRADGL